METLRQVIPHSLKRKNLVEMNMKMIEAAVEYVAAPPVDAVPQEAGAR